MTTSTQRSQGGLKAYRQIAGVGVQQSREAEILRHLPLVHTVVDRIAAHLPPSVDREDLFHAGVIGLIDALGRFDPSRDNAFSTYAVLRIRGAVIDELRERDWVPRSARDRAKSYQQGVEVLAQRLGRTPSDAELAAHLGIPESELADLERGAHLASQVSLDAPAGDEDSLGSFLPDRPRAEDNPARDLESQDLREVLVKALRTLTDQERMVVKLYYFENLLMKEIAAVLGVTESRVCQIHTRVMAALRSRLGRELV